MTDQSTTHSSLRRINKGFHEFWTKPASTKPLAVLRILVATVLLFQAYSWLGSVQALFGRNAIISWDALQSLGAFPLATQGPFHLSYVSELLGPWGMSADDCVMGTYALYVAALVGLLLGYQSRCSAILAFVMHLFLTDSAPATTYGVDQFARIALFYCCWMDVGARLSIDQLLSRRQSDSSVSARIGLRVLQIHLAVMYLATGIHKAAGGQWWNGEAIWRAVTLPQMAQFDMTWLSDVPLVPMFIGWATLAIEIGYCLLVWHRRARIATATAAVCMHLGIAIMLGLTSFAFLMIALNIAAFIVPDRIRLQSNWKQDHFFIFTSGRDCQVANCLLGCCETNRLE